MIWYNIIWYTTIQNNIIWYDMTWHDMIWYITLYYIILYYIILYYNILWSNIIPYDITWYNLLRRRKGDRHSRGAGFAELRPVHMFLSPRVALGVSRMVTDRMFSRPVHILRIRGTMNPESRFRETRSVQGKWTPHEKGSAWVQPSEIQILSSCVGLSGSADGP